MKPLELVLKEADVLQLGVGESELPSAEITSTGQVVWERVYKVVRTDHAIVLFETKDFLAAVGAYLRFVENEAEAQQRLAGTFVEPPNLAMPQQPQLIRPN